ncbi:hypothetical protein TNCV_2330841 [Trichonephila clavipes]|nr:hypothetical protein TNCV_2330841 [Trichonephila clavipes]
MAPLGLIPRHLERAEALTPFHQTTGHDFLGVYIHWGLKRHDLSEAMSGWMVTTCSYVLYSMNTRLSTSSIGAGRLDVKWSKRQAPALDK